MKILKKTINITLIVSIFLLLPIVVLTLITSRTNLISGVQSFVVLTGSMQPAIPVGSIIYTQKQTLYPEGSIVAFKSGDLTVTHRVIKVTNRDNTLYYKTRGDANNTADEKELIANDILGKQMFFLPYVGQAVMFLKTPQGFFPVVIFPIVVFIVLELWNLKKEFEKEMEKKIRSKLIINQQ